MKKIFRKLLQNCNLFKGKANAFTLAEVLITLGIIGIVAAMTIPTLVKKYQAKVLETKFQKSVAIINQIITRTKYNMGIEDIATYCVSQEKCGADINNVLSTYTKTKRWTHSLYYTIHRDTNDIYTYNGKNNVSLSTNENAIFYTNELKDGTFLGYNVGGGYLSFAVDLNGYGKPNRLGHDIFIFAVQKGKNSMLVPWGYTAYRNNDLTDEEATQKWQDSTNASKNYYMSTYGMPCNLDSTRKGNGIGCAYYAMKNKCPYDDTKTYWECLP